MARYDIHRAPDGRGYLLDVQTDLLGGFTTRLVVPLLPLEDAPTPGRGLNPLVEIEGHLHMMATQYLAAVPAALLRQPVGSLASRAEEVTRALDLILHGF